LIWKKKAEHQGFLFQSCIAPALAELVPIFHAEIRERVYTPEITIACLVAGVFARDESLVGCVVRNNRNRILRQQPPASLSTAAFSEARGRLDPKMIELCSEKLAGETLKSILPKAHWRGFHPFVVDGTTLTADDTAENQSHFPQHGKQAEGVGFPIMRCVFLSCLTTGMIHAFRHGAYKGKETGEMALARNVFPKLPEKSLLMGDCYFPSFFVLAMLLKQKHQGLFPSHFARAVDFRRGSQLGPKDHLVTWVKPNKPTWMSAEEYDDYPEEIEVREVDLTKETGSKKNFVVVTTMTKPNEFSKNQLAKMYKNRWKIEVALRDLKSTFSLQHLNAKKPKTIELLIWVHILAYNILMWHMLNAADQEGIEHDQMSVKNAARLVEVYTPLILSSKIKDVPEIMREMYHQMSLVRVGKRPDRHEPRAVKRRPKPHAKLKESRSAWRERRCA
jgi:putative transposase